MLPTYPAVLRDGRIEWTGEAPPGLTADGGVPVHVTFLTPVLTADTEDARRARRAAAMERLAARGGIASIPDPAAWQREVRQDRPLLGRDG